jgi:dienelactone hydrolase
MRDAFATVTERDVEVSAGSISLQGTLALPEQSLGVVLFAHGSGSGRRSPRNRFVAGELHRGGLATLLVDLLTAPEEAVDLHTGHLRFDIPLLADRLVGIMDWMDLEPATSVLPVGLYGASTGAGAALVAATKRPDRVGAIVSRGGRPDLARAALPLVRAPTLLIVGGRDQAVLGLNERARTEMRADVRLEVVPGAGHLFEEPGSLERVAALACDWLVGHLAGGKDAA